MDALMPSVVRATTLLLALLLSACGLFVPKTEINTLALPQGALVERDDPVLAGTSNHDVGNYAIECKAALQAEKDDKKAIRKAVHP